MPSTVRFCRVLIVAAATAVAAACGSTTTGSTSADGTGGTGGADAASLGCKADSDCKYPIPFCDLGRSHVCDTAAGFCVECLVGADCQGLALGAYCISTVCQPCVC